MSEQILVFAHYLFFFLLGGWGGDISVDCNVCILLMAKLFLDGFLLVSPESVPSPTSNDIHQQTMSSMQENAFHSNFTEKHYGSMWCHSYSI